MTNQNFDQIINEQYNFGRMITLFYPLLWLVNKLFPLEKGKILFCTKLGQFSGNAKYFFIYLVKNQRMKAIWKADDKKTYDHISEQFGKQNVIFSKGIIGKLQYLYHYLSANTILIRGRVDAWDLMRLGVKKNKIIMNIGHGSPGPGMKGGGGSMWENVHRRKLNREIKTRRAVTHYVTGSELSRYFMAAGTLVEPSKIHITGMPRTDFIIDGLNNLKSIKNKITSLIKTNMNYDKVILYAPTFREEVATKFFPFKDFSSSYLINVLKKNNAIMLLRTHDQSNKYSINDFNNLNKYLNKRIFYFSHSILLEINDILPCVDVLINDYSSITTDYLLVNKPIIYIPYDLSTYKRGTHLSDYDSWTPGIKVHSSQMFYESLEQALNDPNQYFSERQNLKNIMYKYIDTNSCKRIFDLINV